MASSSSCHGISRPPSIMTRHVRSQYFIVRAQLGHGDEGKSMNNMVDANMNVLRERINQVKIRERLASKYEHQGWCYPPGYDVQLKRSERLAELGKIAAMAAGGFGLSVAGCTILLCLFSLVIHINN